MHAVIAFFLTPIGKYVGLALLVMGVLWGSYAFLESSFRARFEVERERKERAHEQAAKRETDRLLRGDDSGVRGFDRD